jgi:hypothetical protein
MLLMKLHVGHGAFDGFFFGWELEDREAADNFFGFGEWPVDDFDLSTGQLDADTLSGLLESAASFEDAGSDPSSLSFAIASLSALGGGGAIFSVLDHHHELHW